MIIAIDFDGVISMTDTWPAIGAIMPGAREGIERLHRSGNYIIINTCRSNSELADAVEWMRENGISYDRINDNHPAMIKKYDYNSRKIFADIYIDDRNLGGFPGWFSPEIKNLISGNVLKQSMERLQSITKKVSKYFDIPVQELTSKTRKREVVDLQRMLFVHARNVLGLSFQVIGNFFHRDHSTVINGIFKAGELSRSNREFIIKYEQFKILL